MFASSQEKWIDFFIKFHLSITISFVSIKIIEINSWHAKKMKTAIFRFLPKKIKT